MTQHLEATMSDHKRWETKSMALEGQPEINVHRPWSSRGEIELRISIPGDDKSLRVNAVISDALAADIVGKLQALLKEK